MSKVFTNVAKLNFTTPLASDTVTVMTGIKPTIDGIVFDATGYYAAGDNGGGQFRWDATSTATSDGGSVINPTGNTGAGRWLRIFPEDSEITFEMWGAQKLDDLDDVGFDSTSAINACLAFLAGFASVAANWKTPRKVIVVGLYGITDTINFISLFGIKFLGVNTFNYQSSGFRWLGTPDPTKPMCFVRGCRACTFEYLRGIATLTNSTTTCCKAFWELSGTIAASPTNTIQERCVWRNIMAGERDGYDRGAGIPLPIGGGYQFKYMFLGSGNNTNNDFHTFEFIRCQSVEWGFWNADSNFVDWCIRDSRFHFCDHIAYWATNKVRFERCEGNHIQDTVFRLGNKPGVIPDFILDGFLSENTYGNLITADTTAQIVLMNCGIDCCYDAAFPYVIDIRSNENVYLEINNCRFYNAEGPRQNTIAVSAPGGASKTIKTRGSSQLIYDTSGSSAAARIYIDEQLSAIRFPTGLTDEGYRPTANLLSGSSDPTYSRERFDIPQEVVRFGNRFQGGSSSIQHVTYDSGTISSGATYTFTNAIPANCIVLGVTAYNAGGFPSITDYDIGVSGTVDKYGTKSPAANGTTPSANSINDYTGTGPEYSKAATSVILTANGANFAGGRCFLTIHYITLNGRFYNPDNAQ